MEDKKLTEKESIEVITAMIARTKARYIGNGNILSMWGYLIVFVSILIWILLATTRQNVWNWLWFAIPLIGCPVAIMISRKQRCQDSVITYSDKITSRLWTIFGVSEIILALICLGFALIGEINCWSAMLIYSILLAPAAEIAQGLIVRERSLVGGGLIGLTVGVITLCCVVGRIPLNVNWYMPLYILTWVAMMIVPGHILNYKMKRR